MISAIGRSRALRPGAIALTFMLSIAACSSAATPAATLAPSPAPTQTPSATGTPATTDSPALVRISEVAGIGSFLTGPDGRSLYLFTKDAEATSNCAGQCAANWPPLVVADGEMPTGGDGVTGTLSTIERADGTRQVTYNGIPLYYWVGDAKAGDTLGQGVNNVWFLVTPTSTTAGGTIVGGIGQPTSGATQPPATQEPAASDSFAY